MADAVRIGLDRFVLDALGGKAFEELVFPVHKVGDRIIKLAPERPLGYSNFWAWWKRVEAEAGVRHRKPHMMRHTFATDTLDAKKEICTPFRPFWGTPRPR